jgi:hypothetical protein
MLAVAVFTYLKPDSLRSGTDPTPRSWFVLAAVSLILFANGVIIIAL